MTVRKLIAALSKLPGNLPAHIDSCFPGVSTDIDSVYKAKACHINAGVDDCGMYGPCDLPDRVVIGRAE